MEVKTWQMPIGWECIRRKADCMALYHIKKVSGNVCSSGSAAPSSPDFPSRKVQLVCFAGCSVHLKLFPILFGGIFGDMLRQTHCVG